MKLTDFGATMRRRQPLRSVWLPGWLIDPRRRCRHDHQRGIYGDEILAAGGRRGRCLDCGRLLPELPRNSRCCLHPHEHCTTSTCPCVPA